jgi:hypothetical protein
MITLDGGTLVPEVTPGFTSECAIGSTQMGIAPNAMTFAEVCRKRWGTRFARPKVVASAASEAPPIARGDDVERGSPKIGSGGQIGTGFAVVCPNEKWRNINIDA